MGKRGGGRGGRGGGIAFSKPKDPAFLQKFKEQMGYKESASVDAKREELPSVDEDDLKDRDDERPTVVVLKKGDISAEEAARLNLLDDLDTESKDVDKDGKILFKKPTKREATDEDNELEAKKNKKKKIIESNMKQIKNKSLLSFDDEEDDDNDDDE